MGKPNSSSPRLMTSLFDELDTTKQGVKAESEIAWIFFLAGHQVSKGQKDCTRDLQVTIQGASYWIEIKNEDNQAHTGNLCIELWQGSPQRPSGILTSESTVIIHTLRSMVALYRTQHMRNYIIFELGETGRGFGKSDNNNAGVIVPIDEVRAYRWFDYCRKKDLPESEILR